MSLLPAPKILSRLPDIQGALIQPAPLPASSDLSHFDTTGVIRLVFLGTGTHAADFAKVASGVSSALQNNPRLHLTTLLGKRGGELIASGVQVNNLRNMFFPKFQTWLQNQRFHIALAPYEPNPVNNSRSSLKVYQHAVVGAAGLYSKTTPFLDAVEDGTEGIMLDYDSPTWADGINQLATDLARARQIANVGIGLCSSKEERNAGAEQWAAMI